MEAIMPDYCEVRALIAYHKEQAKFHVDRGDDKRVQEHLDRRNQLFKLLPPEPNF